MKILVVGLNHKSAPIEIREKLAFNANQTRSALRQLKDRFRQAEFVILSTCNRVELYCASPSQVDVGGVAEEELVKFLAGFHNIPLQELQGFVYTYDNEDSVRHLLTVASSLDSMVVGEAQIIGQVKESYQLACVTKSTGKILNHLFHCAFATSKKVHTNTSISSGRVSIASIAVELAMQLFADISAAKVVVIGAGQMAELLLRHLLHAGCKNITVVNRSYEHGLSIARRYGADVCQWEELTEQLTNANIVIGSAATQNYLFNKDSFKKIMAYRRQKGLRPRFAVALLIIDIAVPRNFEPSINELEDVYVYSVDELSEVAQQNRKAREDDIAKGMQIIHEKVTEFMDWFRTRDIGPLIGKMKKIFVQIGQNELERFFVGARQKAPCREVAEAMVNRIVNKLLHCVIKNVNTVARENGAAEAARLVHSIVQQADQISSAEPNNKETPKDDIQS